MNNRKSFKNNLDEYTHTHTVNKKIILKNKKIDKDCI